MQVLTVISAVAALLLVITSSFVLNEAYMEFSTSESALSTSSTADQRREREEYNFRVGILAAEVRRLVYRGHSLQQAANKKSTIIMFHKHLLFPDCCRSLHGDCLCPLLLSHLLPSLLQNWLVTTHLMLKSFFLCCRTSGPPRLSSAYRQYFDAEDVVSIVDVILFLQVEAETVLAALTSQSSL